jgi:UDP-N-acetylmuramoyl-L-alanyl-D-glutamate--2,6-diaminopimelate ligase
MNAPAPFLISRRPLRELLAGYADSVHDCMVGGLTLDSRAAEPGSLFLAVRGTRGHGLAHVGEALARGATAVAWEPAAGVEAPALNVPAVAVDQLGARAGDIAARYYGMPSTKLFVAGVTGTDGKTSTAHLIAQGFEALGVPCGYLGTIGRGRLGRLAEASHTTMDAVSVQRNLAELLRDGASACAMEVSSHALDQSRVAGVHFGVAVLTNVGRDHLDYHGTVEAYAAAKRKLFFDCAPQAIVLNRDDPWGARWVDEAQIAGRPQSQVTVYGFDAGGPSRWVLAREVETRRDGLRIGFDSSWGAATFDSRLLGRFNACNLLAALAALLVRGIPLDAAVAALAQARTVPGRMERFGGPQAVANIVVDYAHTPQALRHALAALRPHTVGRLICVFGCGGDRDRGKRPLMGAAAAELADAVIVTDDNPRSEDPGAIVAEILDGVANEHRSKVSVEHDRARAIERAVRAAGADDIVLVAGKGHEDYQIYGSDRRDFSDREFVAGLLGTGERA